MPTDFVLEKLVHHVLRGDPHPGRQLIADSLMQGASSESLLLDILWPTIECLHQLRFDRTIGGRIYNSAARTLGSLIDQVSLRLPRRQSSHTDRALLLLCAPGDSDELGAQLLAALAESHGFTVHFAGRNLTPDEITFALGQLEPDVVVMYGSALCDREAARKSCRRLTQIGIRPAVQLMVIGAILTDAADGLGADLIARNPLEALELLALSPDYRVQTQESDQNAKARPLASSPPGQLLDGSHPMAISQDVIRNLMNWHFRSFLNYPN